MQRVIGKAGKLLERLKRKMGKKDKEPYIGPPTPTLDEIQYIRNSIFKEADPLLPEEELRSFCRRVILCCCLG